MKRFKFSQIFDLKNKAQAKNFKKVLARIEKKNICAPVLKKGPLRLIDTTIKNSKLDETLLELLSPPKF